MLKPWTRIELTDRAIKSCSIEEQVQRNKLETSQPWDAETSWQEMADFHHSQRLILEPILDPASESFESVFIGCYNALGGYTLFPACWLVQLETRGYKPKVCSGCYPRPCLARVWSLTNDKRLDWHCRIRPKSNREPKTFLGDIWSPSRFNCLALSIVQMLLLKISKTYKIVIQSESMLFETWSIDSTYNINRKGSKHRHVNVL